jgi:hypothetical protein
MERRRLLAVLCAVLLAVVLATVVLPVVSGPPTVTVENHDEDRRYRVTAYAVPDVDRRTDVRFAATTDDGRERVDYERAFWERDLRNVTVVSEYTANATTVAPADGNATVELSGYDGEPTVVYVVETRDTERVVHVSSTGCDEHDQTVTVHVADGRFRNGSSVCA